MLGFSDLGFRVQGLGIWGLVLKLGFRAHIQKPGGLPLQY